MRALKTENEKEHGRVEIFENVNKRLMINSRDLMNSSIKTKRSKMSRMSIRSDDNKKREENTFTSTQKFYEQEKVGDKIGKRNKGKW
jgi:hypothetical protein